jgi:hypothetical protein
MDPHLQPGSPSLASLPTELLAQVASLLPVQDFRNLRLTSKGIESALYHTFCQRYFSNRQYMLTESSLQNLVDVSEHVDLSHALKTVVVMPHRFLSSGREHAFAHRYVPDRTPYTTEDYRVWNDAYTSQQRVMYTGQDRDMMAKAFANLPRLNAVWFLDESDADSTSGPLKPFGVGDVHSGQLRSVHGTRCENSLGYHYSRMFMITLDALAQARARPTSIGNELLGLEDLAFYIPKQLELSMEPLLRNLKYLSLTLYLGDEWKREHQKLTPPTRKIEVNHSQHLQHFLSLASNLESLKLTMERDFMVEDQLLTWLALRPEVPRRSADEVWPSYPEVPASSFLALKQLELQSAEMSTRTLKELLRKFGPTLRDLKLVDITLHEVKELDRIPTKPKEWSKAFRYLAENSHLHSIELIDLRMYYAGVERLDYEQTMPVILPTKEPFPGARGHDMCETQLLYSGHQMRGPGGFLDDLASRLAYPLPHHQVNGINQGAAPQNPPQPVAPPQPLLTPQQMAALAATVTPAQVAAAIQQLVTLQGMVGPQTIVVERTVATRFWAMLDSVEFYLPYLVGVVALACGLAYAIHMSVVEELWIHGLVFCRFVCLCFKVYIWDNRYFQVLYNSWKEMVERILPSM